MYISGASPTEITAAIAALQIGPQDALLVLAAEKTETDVQALVALLKTQEVPFFGGIFPGIIVGSEQHDKGIILHKFRRVSLPFLVQGLADGKPIELDQLEGMDEDRPRTAIVFLDGLAPGISAFLERINNTLGDKVHFIGGGAGSLSLAPSPCVFTNAGVFADAAVGCVIDAEINLGIRHGWEKLAGPLVATRTAGNIIYELNWENAYDVYRATIEAEGQDDFRQHEFFDIAKRYPFGMMRENEEDIVRDPIAVGAQGELICVGEVPSNTVLHVLKGRKENLIAAAQRAVADCRQHMGEQATPDHALVIDCISRALFLEEDFTRELAGIQQQMPGRGAGEQQEKVVQGVLSLGEIGSYGLGILEFFNKTIVVGLVNAPR